jgi:hypothetical protein
MAGSFLLASAKGNLKQAQPMRGEVMGKIWGRLEKVDDVQGINDKKVVSRGHFPGPRQGKLDGKNRSPH